MHDTVWTQRGGRALGPAPFFIAGVVNATPDSFFDGGQHQGTAAAVAHGALLARQGADILDVGGESTRPFAEPVTLEQELERVVPVIRGLAAADLRDVNGLSIRPILSVDTFKGRVAAQAMDAGADMVNDVSACAYDPELIDVISQYKPGYVLMHSQGRPREMQQAPVYGDVVGEILAFFEEKLSLLVRAGLPETNIVLDPGIGFGKLLQHNVAILRGIDRLAALGRPIYVGLSNKSLWQGMLGLSVDERGNATQAATALLAARGVAVHRVHDVVLTRQTLTIVRELA